MVTSAQFATQPACSRLQPPWDLSAAVDPSKHGQARQRERSRLRAVLWRNQAAERRAEQVRLKQAREASLDAQLQRAITSLERRDEQLERMGEVCRFSVGKLPCSVPSVGCLVLSSN